MSHAGEWFKSRQNLESQKRLSSSSYDENLFGGEYLWTTFLTVSDNRGLSRGTRIDVGVMRQRKGSGLRGRGGKAFP